ncbi:hypothetical protein PHISP_03879 [Aspergillus sp. HF37]|nr:hypothetical protein PHISP_03879 [Aspergillus sp. HF37]
MPPRRTTRATATTAPTDRATTTRRTTVATTKGPSTKANTTAKKTNTMKTTGAANKKAANNSTAAKEPKPTPATTASASKKRKATADEAEPAREPKKSRVAKPRALAPRPKVVINQTPTAKLNVYVCGEGSFGELGLGSAKSSVDVKRPRLNPLLPADKVGVVQVAVGGMHCVALTHNNKILTWGVNDQGALGRDTAWDGGYKDIDENKSDSGSDSEEHPGLNPYESTPTAIPTGVFPEGTVFVEVAASDSSSFALTDDGQVYGWGTFRVKMPLIGSCVPSQANGIQVNDGVLGFDAISKVQFTPALIPALKKIKHLACGSNHVLALNEKGAVFSWGSGQQNQLGRRIIERNKLNGLQPREFGLPKNILHIGCGAFHSFAVHKSGRVYAWGLNSYGETGIRTRAGDDEATIDRPTVVDSLSEKHVVQVSGGAHHSLAVTSEGHCLAWGRLDGYQSGLKIDSLRNDTVIKDERGRPRILIDPTPVPGIYASVISAKSDHSLAIDVNGRPWSWGFSATYQTGQGTLNDVEVATMVENTAVRGKKLNWVGAGGQFSVFTGAADL